MTLVIDSSVALAWLFADESSDRADAVMREVATSGAVVPSLWRLEIANALQTAVRRKRINAKFRDSSIADLRSLPIHVDAETDDHAWTTTLALSERCRLTVYDAAYLELALRLRVPLASLDAELGNACRVMRVAVTPG